jgi:hypothetical protein
VDVIEEHLRINLQCFLRIISMHSPQLLLSLNFLALVTQDFEFLIYRKRYEPSEQKRDVNWYRHSLPIAPDRKADADPERAEYWVSLSQEKGFESFRCDSRDNHRLTVKVLRQALELKAIAANLPYEKSRNRFVQSINFKQKEHPEGWEIIYLEPYFLSAEDKFGFLIDFRFRKREDVAFSRRVQQLSLSLDEDWRSNANFYIDRLKKIQVFVNKSLKTGQISPLKVNSSQNIEIEHHLYPLKAKVLKPRTFVFAGGKESEAQLAGLRRYGPLETIKPPVNFHFTFSEQLRDDAAELYKALNGELYPNVFSGIESVFKLPHLGKQNTKGYKLVSLNSESIQSTVQEIKEFSTNSAIQVVVLPSKESAEYLDLKYYALQAELPLQIVTADLIRNENTFKWSVSGIGLQIFAKLGGKPWKVKPSNQDCLIIGIGQAHRIQRRPTGETTIQKYFAYSVLMDSSGIYRDIKILGDSINQDDYLSQLKSRIREIVEQFRGEFSKFVIHTPFKLKQRELDTIKDSLEQCSHEAETSEREFVVMKVNESNKFFGYDFASNSFVPPESSCLQISGKEFLIWFEGIQQHNPNIKRRYSGPAHIEFYYMSHPLSFADKTRYLQDIINLSGANWRGFNAKSLPISIYYCKLIAWKIRDFYARGYYNLKINTSTPWFL